MTTILYIILGIVLLIIILSMIGPKHYDVSRSIEIERPKADVFEYLKYLKNQQKWSPWDKKEPDMEKRFTGTDGEVGAISYWKGKKVGEGEQEITKIVAGERMEGELRFMKPFKSTSDCYLIAEEVTPQSTKVIWGFKGKNAFPMTIMALFMNMDKMVGKDFEEGLQDLKIILEKK
ncbi:SRPBCC family protein [Sediminicola sp. 1XM1-17]|uniref:SRPBCC family protein n=1 Tax=Sediminicola sp. 1XM1-17 TaxID=3127702 RepID=UPI003077049F